MLNREKRPLCRHVSPAKWGHRHESMTLHFATQPKGCTKLGLLAARSPSLPHPQLPTLPKSLNNTHDQLRSDCSAVSGVLCSLGSSFLLRSSHFFPSSFRAISFHPRGRSALPCLPPARPPPRVAVKLGWPQIYTGPISETSRPRETFINQQ